MNDEQPRSEDERHLGWQELVEQPERALSPLQRRWLSPLGWSGSALRELLYGINRVSMKTLFRLQVDGLQYLPQEPPLILTPTHTSSLDPFALAAALPGHLLRRTYWAGRSDAVLAGPLRRAVNRVAQVVPIERQMRSLAAAAAVLQKPGVLVWFPEGTRSRSGKLQTFKFGIGVLLKHLAVPAIPVAIEGARRAAPPPHHWPRRFSRIQVAFGRAVRADEIPVPSGGEGGEEIYEAIAAALHDRVQALAQSLEKGQSAAKAER